jgi:hypothetical protein
MPARQAPSADRPDRRPVRIDDAAMIRAQSSLPVPSSHRFGPHAASRRLRTTGARTTLLDLKVSLDNKLAYIANNIVNADKGSDPIVGFVTIGSLKKGELLTNEQAQVAYEILGMQQHDLELLTPNARAVFFSGASALVSSLRIIVFASFVYKRLKIPSWKRQPVSGDSRDFVIRSTDSGDPTVHHIVPVIASKKATFVYERAQDLARPFLAGPVPHRRGDGLVCQHTGFDAEARRELGIDQPL